MTETLLLDHDEVHTSRMPIPSMLYGKTAGDDGSPPPPRSSASLSTFGALRGEQVSPNRKCSLNLLEEGRPLLSGGMIHIVVGEVVAAHGVAWH